jgi:hypothetical protein
VLRICHENCVGQCMDQFSFNSSLESLLQTEIKMIARLYLKRTLRVIHTIDCSLSSTLFFFFFFSLFVYNFLIQDTKFDTIYILSIVHCANDIFQPSTTAPDNLI